MATPTYSELLDAAKSALLRLFMGAERVSVNGQQFHYTSAAELERLISKLEVKVAESAGTDGRGAWEASFES